MGIFYVSLGGVSENGIRFYPSRLDFAVPEVAILTQMTQNDTNPIY